MNGHEIYNFVLVLIGILVLGVSATHLVPIFPSAALSRGVSVSQSGIILGFAFIPVLVFTPFAGKLIGCFGAKKLFTISILINAAQSVGFGFLNYVQDGTAFFWISLSLRILTALAESLVTPTGYILGMQQLSKQNHGKAVSMIESSWGVGMSFGPTLGGALAELGGFKLPFWAVGGALTAIGIGMLFFKSDVSVEMLDDKRGTSWKQMLSTPGISMHGVSIIFGGVSQAWYMASMEPYLLTEFGLDSVGTGLVLMSYGLTYTLLSPLFGVFMDKGLTPLTAVVVGNITISASYIILGPVPGVQILNTVPVKVASLILQGIGAACSFIGSLIGIIECSKSGDLPQNEQTTGMATSVWLMGICLGLFLGSSGGSFTYDKFGFSISCMVQAALMALSVVCVFLLKPKEKKGKELSI